MNLIPTESIKCCDEITETPQLLKCPNFILLQTLISSRKISFLMWFVKSSMLRQQLVKNNIFFLNFIRILSLYLITIWYSKRNQNHKLELTLKRHHFVHFSITFNSFQELCDVERSKNFLFLVFKIRLRTHSLRVFFVYSNKIELLFWVIVNFHFKKSLDTVEVHCSILITSSIHFDSSFEMLSGLWNRIFFGCRTRFVQFCSIQNSLFFATR